jgi:hypothetical protein
MLLVSGCVSGQGDEDDSVGLSPNVLEDGSFLTPSALNANALNANALDANALDANALNANALNANALNANALNANDLSANALSPSTLNARASAAIQLTGQEGDLSRQLLLYTVSCALDTTQSFSFSWTDQSDVVHQETYWGLLALATSWATKPLGTSDAEWVTACLASRVNWYGEAVMLSSRGDRTSLSTDSQERTAFPNVEGAFWGNLFTAQPQVFACHYSPNDENSRGHLRDCAAGHINSQGDLEPCGIIQLVGTCETLCSQPSNDVKYYPSCSGPTPTTRPITVFLP